MNQITVELSDVEAKCLAMMLRRAAVPDQIKTPFVADACRSAVAAVLHELDDVLAGVADEN